MTKPLADTVAEMRKLLDAATTGEWFATDAPYSEGDWGAGTLAARYPWTVSLDPAKVGWNTDGGTNDYGILRDDAAFIAASKNAMPAILDALEARTDALRQAVDTLHVTARRLIALNRSTVEINGVLAFARSALEDPS